LGPGHRGEAFRWRIELDVLATEALCHSQAALELEPLADAAAEAIPEVLQTDDPAPAARPPVTDDAQPSPFAAV
jgi:hypothetical protein